MALVETNVADPFESARLVCITATSLQDAWPAVSGHVQALPNSAKLIRAVAENRGSLWCVYDASGRAFFDVQAVAVVGASNGAVRLLAASPGFPAAHARMAMFFECHRSGCRRVAIAGRRVVIELPPELPRLAYEKAVDCGVFRPPLNADGFQQQMGNG